MARTIGIGLAAVIGLLVVFGLVGTCNSANDELARTARVAVENSREAMRQNDAAYIWPGRLRILGIALGVTVPVAAAVILAHLAFRHRPEELEVLAEVRREQKHPGVAETPELTQEAGAGKPAGILPARPARDSTPK